MNIQQLSDNYILILKELVSFRTTVFFFLIVMVVECQDELNEI